MRLTKDDVKGIADYARIALDESSIDAMTEYMNSAIDLLDEIKQFDIEGVEPTFHPIGSLVNVMGDDVEIDTRALSLDEALHNAASTHERSFRVPSILGDDGGDR